MGFVLSLTSGNPIFGSAQRDVLRPAWTEPWLRTLAIQCRLASTFSVLCSETHQHSRWARAKRELPHVRGKHPQRTAVVWGVRCRLGTPFGPTSHIGSVRAPAFLPLPTDTMLQMMFRQRRSPEPFVHQYGFSLAVGEVRDNLPGLAIHHSRGALGGHDLECRARSERRASWIELETRNSAVHWGLRCVHGERL